MNLYRFLLHSSWVAIAITIFFPSSAQSAEVSSLSTVQKNAGVAGNKRVQTQMGKGSAVDLMVSSRGINIYSSLNNQSSNNSGIANYTVHHSNKSQQQVDHVASQSQIPNTSTKNLDQPLQISQLAQSSNSGRSVEFVRPDQDMSTRSPRSNRVQPQVSQRSQRNIFQYIRADQVDHHSQNPHDDANKSNSPTPAFPSPSGQEVKNSTGGVMENTVETSVESSVEEKVEEKTTQEAIHPPVNNSVNSFPNISQPQNIPSEPTSQSSPQPYPPSSPDTIPVNHQPTSDSGNSVDYSAPANSPKPNTYKQDLLEVPTQPEQVQLRELQSLTLEQTLEIAKQNNPEFQAALLRVERGRASLREARAELYPKLNLNGSIENSQSASDELGVERGVVLPQSDEAATRFSGQAEFRYSIFTSGRRDATIREAEERLSIDKFDVEEKYRTLRLNTTLRYYDLQSADEQVRIGQSAVENAQASLRDAQSLERAGVGTKFDVLRSQVNLANAQQDLTNSLSQQRIARRRLATLLSFPSNVNIATAEPVKIAGLWDPSLEQTVVQAFEQRSELQQRLAERNVAQQRRRQALAAKGPQVDFVATYDLLDQYNDDISVTDGYSIGVRASLNLFDGGAAKARASQAKADIAIAETNFASQRDQIRFEVEQYYSQLQSNQENVQTATLALEQATEALRLARLRFQAGVGTQTDVISAENDLTRAEANRITAILDYNRALANLERAVAIHKLETKS